MCQPPASSSAPRDGGSSHSPSEDQSSPRTATVVAAGGPSPSDDELKKKEKKSTGLLLLEGQQFPLPLDDPRVVLNRGSRLASTSLGLLLVAYSLTMPHQHAVRDRLGCDALCTGSLTSARSFLKLVGSAVMGRLSDLPSMCIGGGGVVVVAARDGRTAVRYSSRTVCLWIGLASAGLSLLAARRAESIQDLWRGLLPEAFEQNAHIFKAHVSQYQNFPGITSADRAASSGSLGLSIGLAMMVGPILGSHLNYDQAVGLGLLLLCVSAGLVAGLPVPSSPAPPPRQGAQQQLSSAERPQGDNPTDRCWWRWLDVPSARSPPAMFLLLSRLLSTTAYHIYQTMLIVSLRERFHFTPVDYGRFFSFIGFFFALSQGVLAKLFLLHLSSRGGGDSNTGGKAATSHQHRQHARLLVACSLTITVTRYFGYRSRNVRVVYAVFALMVSAYGVMSTVVAADTARIAAPNELGSFFGLLASVEGGAGMVGPFLGGALNSLFRSNSSRDPPALSSSSSSSLSLWAVLLLNGLGTLLLARGYERIVLRNLNPIANEQSRHVKHH